MGQMPKSGAISESAPIRDLDTDETARGKGKVEWRGNGRKN